MMDFLRQLVNAANRSSVVFYTVDARGLAYAGFTAADEWKMLSDPNGGAVPSNPMSDTALRRFKRGLVLRYGYDVYNAKLDGAKRPSLHTRMRLFRDGKLVLDGQPQPIDLTAQKDMGHIKSSRALALGTEIPLGDYILQIIVTDDLAKANERIATQFVQFEVVE